MEIIPQRSDNGGDAVHHPDALRRASPVDDVGHGPE